MVEQSTESLIIRVEESSKDRRGDLTQQLAGLLVRLAKDKKIEGFENLTPASFTVAGILVGGEKPMVGERLLVEGSQSNHEGNLFVNNLDGEVFKWDKEGKSWLLLKDMDELWNYIEPYLRRKVEFLTPKIKEEQK